jgi:hypothetical protein
MTVYAADGSVISSSSASSPNGSNLVFHVSGGAAGAQFSIGVASATSGVFAVGSYRLTVKPDVPIPTGTPATSHFDDGGDSHDGPSASSRLLDGGESLPSIPGPVVGVNYVHVHSPETPLGGQGAMTLTAMVFATQAGAASPVVDVYDALGNHVAGQVLVKENGSYVVQVIGVTANSDYTVAVRPADPTATLTAGSYHLSVAFTAAASQLDQYAAGTLTAAASQDFKVLQVNAAQWFHFVLSAAADTPAAVRMTIYDTTGNIVQSQVIQAGDQLSATLFLLPGTYTFRFAAGALDGQPLTDTSYQLLGIALGDPIGPQLVNPTTVNVPAPAPLPPVFVWTGPTLPFYLSFLTLTDLYSQP